METLDSVVVEGNDHHTLSLLFLLVFATLVVVDSDFVAIFAAPTLIRSLVVLDYLPVTVEQECCRATMTIFLRLVVMTTRMYCWIELVFPVVVINLAFFVLLL